jgi:hypothetical protein
VARWEYNENTDKMNFTIVSSSPNKWTGIGFSDTPSMSLTDAIIGKRGGGDCVTSACV